MNARGKFRYALLLAGTLSTAAPCYAAQTDETVDARITRLEQELTELKALVKTKPSTTAAADIQIVQPESAKKIDPQSPLQVTSASGVKVQLYGFARFDASYDTNAISSGNYALWVLPKNGRNTDSEWNLTGAATRLGMNLSGPDTESMKLTGNIEMDFLSNIGAENNSSPRLRHAFLKAYWPASDFSILAGQTWDLVSSLIPFVDDVALMWEAGNIGSRHPQLRATKGFPTGNDGRLEMAVAASRSIGEKSFFQADTGKDAVMPTIQGRLAFSEPLIVKEQPATIAVSGHYGQEEWDTTSTGNYKQLDSWSCNLEVTMPLSKKLLLAGECFTGSNLDDFLGGIGQGVNASIPTAPRNIRTHGGWTALKYNMNPVTSISLGAGIDDPNNNDIPALGRTLNQTVFATLINRITPNFILGLQLSQWKTEYKNAPESDAFRAQTSLTYTF